MPSIRADLKQKGHPAKYVVMDFARGHVRTRKLVRGIALLVVAALRLAKPSRFTATELLMVGNPTSRPIHSGCPDKRESALSMCGSNGSNDQIQNGSQATYWFYSLPSVSTKKQEQDLDCARSR
jgi:hypothetical protein